MRMVKVLLDFLFTILICLKAQTLVPAIIP